MKTTTVAYAISTTVAVVAFAGSGIANVVRARHVAADMMHLGYPTYFMSVLGAWKLAGAVAIALPRFPRVKEWAYAGMIFDLTGAAASRAASNDAVVTVLVPLLIACVVTTSWTLRPPARRLLAGHAQPV